MTGYLYILKHGIGPGTMPNDVTILKEKDLPNYYTAVWLDRFLTTSELKQYDIPSETRINELLDRIDYCQADNGDDVVPCDEVNACDNITTSKKIVASKMSDIDLLANEALECTTRDELSAVISGLDSLGFRKLYLHYMEMLRDDSLSVGYIASDLSDTLYNMFSGKVNACDKVMASDKIHYDTFEYFNMIVGEDLWLCCNLTGWFGYLFGYPYYVRVAKLGQQYAYVNVVPTYNSINGYSYDINDFNKFANKQLKYEFDDIEILDPQLLSTGDLISKLGVTRIDACDKINASTKSKYFANMVSASEFNSFDDEYGIHRVSKSDLNYIKDSIYERVSESTDIKFSIDMTITKQLPDAIAKVHITLRNLDDGTIVEYDDRVDSNNLEGTIQRLTKFAKALITENWSEYPDNLTDEDIEHISGDIYDEIETTIFDYYLYGAPDSMLLYDAEDPTLLYNIDTDYSDLSDSLTFNIKLEALDRDDLEGLVEDYLKPITSDYNTEYTIEHSNTGRTGKTGYIHIKFQ